MAYRLVRSAPAENPERRNAEEFHDDQDQCAVSIVRQLLIGTVDAEAAPARGRQERGTNPNEFTPVLKSALTDARQPTRVEHLRIQGRENDNDHTDRGVAASVDTRLSLTVAPIADADKAAPAGETIGIPPARFNTLMNLQQKTRE
jgi:hypothetical protein